MAVLTLTVPPSTDSDNKPKKTCGANKPVIPTLCMCFASLCVAEQQPKWLHSFRVFIANSFLLSLARQADESQSERSNHRQHGGDRQ